MLAKKTQNTPTCDIPPENSELESKNFLWIETRRLAESAEGLNTSLALAAGKLWPKKYRPL